MPGLEQAIKSRLPTPQYGDDYRARSRRRGGKVRRRKKARATGGRQRSYITKKDQAEFEKMSPEEKIQRAGKGIGSLAKIGEKLASEQGQKFLSALKGAPIGAGAIGLAIAAGLAAYGLTTYAINKIKDRKEGRQQLAFQASQAYRYARTELAEKKGRALTRPEQLQLANDFKQELKKLGLTTTNISG